MADYSMTGLRYGLADEISDFLKGFNDGMQDVTGILNNSARILDNHKANNITNSLNNIYEGFFNAIQIQMESVQEITNECLRELEEKNETLGDSVLDEDIQTMKTASDGLLDNLTFTSAELGGVENFTGEDAKETAECLLNLSDSWQDTYNSLFAKAKEFAEEEEQNEMSRIYEIVMNVFNLLKDKLGDCIEEVLVQHDEIRESYEDSKGRGESQAEDNSSRAANNMASKMEEPVKDYSEFYF